MIVCHAQVLFNVHCRTSVGLNYSLNINALFHTGGHGPSSIDRAVGVHVRFQRSHVQIPRSHKEHKLLHAELKLFNKRLKAKIDEDKDKLEKARAHAA
jgi:hypothetical protein